jgi:site-specific DNA-methyltransferase (adenine-specific)
VTAETFLDGRVTLHGGDNREILREIPDCSIDSIVTDPPYALVSIVKRFGKSGCAAVKVPEGGSGAYARASAGFMGKAWDTGETAFAVEFWAECLRVLKPGGHVVAFSGTRTYHRMACAIEDAGFEIRDQLAWTYGTGFNKKGYILRDADGVPTGPWGGALKPAWEPICFGRKALTGTVAANIADHGTGAINIDACRIESEKQTGWGGKAAGGNTWNETNSGLSKGGEARPSHGRWPANILHDGSEEVVRTFPIVGDAHPPSNEGSIRSNQVFGADNRPREFHAGFHDSGSAARFFYTAKADADDRLGSKHPTVKPVDLMQWLCRLVTPKGGMILDPFAGTGTTGEAAFREGFNAILIEREDEYQADIRRRMALCMSGPEERKRESIKAKVGEVPFEPGSLFAGIEAAE